MKYLLISILLLIFTITITIKSSQANIYSPTIFTLDVLENDDFGESGQWSWDCNYSKNQIYLEFQEVPVQDPEEDFHEGFFTPGFGNDKCKISFDIKNFVPTSIGFQGFLKRGAQVKVNVVYGSNLENFRISGNDLLDDNGVWTGDLKYYEEISENFHIEFTLHTSTSLSQNDLVELEYDHSIAVVDKIWIIAYRSSSASATDDDDEDDENLILAQSIVENDFEKLIDDQQNEVETEETTETPQTDKPLVIIGEMSTLQDIIDSEDWDTSCDYKASSGDICTPVVSPPDGKTGFFAPCNQSMQFRCTIVYSNDQKEIFSFKPNVFIDGDGTVQVSTTGKKKTTEHNKNERIGIIGTWDSSENILDDDDQSKITFTLTGSGSGDVAIVESIVIMGWEKDFEKPDDDDDKTLMIVLISVGGAILLVGLGVALYFLKKRSDRKKKSKVRNNYDSDSDAAENYPNPNTSTPQQYNYNYNSPRKSLSQGQGQSNQGYSSTTMEEDNSARRYFSSTPRQLLSRESSAGLGASNPTNYGGVPLPGLTSTEDPGFSRSGNRMSFSNQNYQPDLSRSSTRMSYSNSNPNDPIGANRFKKRILD